MQYLRLLKPVLVPRFGTTSFIGAEVSPAGAEFVVGTVVALSDQEAARFSREYRRAVKDGDLEKATEAEHKAWNAKVEADAKAAAEARKAAAAAAAEDADSAGDEPGNDEEAAPAKGGSSKRAKR